MNRKIAKMSLALFFITVVSKAVAFIITIVFSHYFGTDMVTDAYYAAGTVPNLVNNSLTICALTLFVPVYTKCLSEVGEKRANEFTSNIMNVFVILNIILFVCVIIASPVLARLVAPGFKGEEIIHTQRMICFLSMSFPFTVATQILNNLYNSNQRYILPAILTIFNQILIIFFSILLAPRFGIYVYPFICTAAWIAQLLILYADSVKSQLFRHRLFINLKDDYFKYILRQSVPVMIATAADQINLAVDNIISSSLSGGSLSCLGYAHRVFNSINGFITATLLTVYYPIIARKYAEKDAKSMNSSLKKYYEIMILLVLPVSTLLIGNAKEIINLLFKHGVMRDGDIKRIFLLFAIYVSGLLFTSLKEFVTRLFYIMGDTRSPAVINSLCVIINIIFSVTFKQFWGIYGIAIATTFATVICTVLESIALLKRRDGKKIFENFIDLKNSLHVITACILSAIIMMSIKNVITTNFLVINIFIYSIIYVLSFLIFILVARREYMLSIVSVSKHK